jgi:hypothetical protein
MLARLTRAQLADHYKMTVDSPSIANLIRKKTLTGLYRLHPESPEDPDLVLYDCFTELSQLRSSTRVQMGHLPNFAKLYFVANRYVHAAPPQDCVRIARARQQQDLFMLCSGTGGPTI